LVQHLSIFVINLSGGLDNSMSLAELTAWCANRFPGYPEELKRKLQLPTSTEAATTRPFDIGWMVLDSEQATKTGSWKPEISITCVCEEIARFAESHPDWLSVTMR